MLIAVAVTALSQVHNFGVLAGGIAVGALIGAVLAARVAMTSMPELVAILHSFVGLAAVLVGVSSYLGTTAPFPSPTEAIIHELEVYIGVFVGAVTFTGSVVAFGKLRGTIGSKPLLLPGRHVVNALFVLVCVGLAVPFLRAEPGGDIRSLVIMACIAGVIGVHL